MKIRRLRVLGIDLLLVLIIAALLTLILWPEDKIELGHDSPRAGAQVCRQYVRHDGPTAAATLVHYLLYLPPEYTESHKLPLVVSLHGAGERGENLRQCGGKDCPGRLKRKTV